MAKTADSTAGRILRAAEKGLELCGADSASLDDYLDFYLEDPALRRSVSSVLFTYFRNKALIDRTIDSTAERGVKPRYRRLLSVVITQGWFQTGIQMESAVNIAVSYAAEKYGKSPSGFINALLRAVFQNGIEAVRAKLSPAERLNLPSGVYSRWSSRWSEDEITAIAEQMRTQPLITFRTCGAFSREELESVSAVPVEGLPWLERWHFYESAQPGVLFRTDWLEKGRIYIQDPATAFAPSLPEISGGERIVDLCAAPGGKSLLLAERLGGSGELIAADKSERRQLLTADNFKRHGLDCKIVTASATEPPFERSSFDIVLIDVPCSNTGVFRRRPDALWRFSGQSLADVVKVQRAIFDAASTLVKPGGQLVYSTCSLELEENELQVAAFAAGHQDFKLKTQQLIMPSGKNDGGFAALLART
ncbi:MAG: RsmB/NOP family class I SAM-dependent RNA methyltransferase [Victivallaceae bacterium]|jgi:16S rRNA (cytosine967-C5)-methyltransferase